MTMKDTSIYRWSDRRKQLAVSLLGTAPVEEVANQLGLSKDKLLSACSRFGWSYAYKVAKPVRLTQDQKNQIKRMAVTHTVKEISKATGVNPNAIRSHAHYSGFSVRANSEKSAHSTIPNSDVNLMRDLHDEGLSCAEIAEKFDISHVHAWEICTFRSRADVI